MTSIALLLFLQLAERKPPSVVAVVGIAISWTLALVTILRFKMDIAKARRDLNAETQKKLAARDDELAAMVRRTCDNYITGKDYIEQRDARVRELIAIATRDALDKYGPAFASAESRQAIEQRFASLEKDVRALQTFLASRVSFKIDK